MFLTIWAYRKHHLMLSMTQLFIFFLGSATAFALWCRYHIIVPRDESDQDSRLDLKGCVECLSVRKRWLTLAGLLLVSGALAYLLARSNNGPFDYTNCTSRWTCVTRLLCIDLNNQVLVNEQKGEFGGYWVDLHEVNLEGANLYATILKQANLKDAQLRWARLSFANLEKADLTKADLRNATLMGAKLQEAVIELGKLSESYLYKADLRHANLRFAQLQNAQLHQADLLAANLFQAKFYNADLSETNLQDANLDSAVLLNADLKGATLNGANLANANLRGAKNLTLEQLKQARSLYQAQLDSALGDALKTLSPSLFNKPER
jgi:uncharacterized protein YjbI with pentapeptide repeats